MEGGEGEREEDKKRYALGEKEGRFSFFFGNSSSKLKSFFSEMGKKRREGKSKKI